VRTRGRAQPRPVELHHDAAPVHPSLQTVFRFLHALTTRIEEVDAVGVAIVESTVHDEEAMGTIRELFDGVIETDLDGSLSVDLPTADGDSGIPEH